MIFEEALKKMREGYEVGLEKGIDDEVFRINNNEIERLRYDGEWAPIYLDGEQILSKDWYVR